MRLQTHSSGKISVYVNNVSTNNGTKNVSANNVSTNNVSTTEQLNLRRERTLGEDIVKLSASIDILIIFKVLSCANIHIKIKL